MGGTDEGMATKAAFRNTLRRRGNLAVNRIAVMLLAAGLLLGGCQRQEENTITYYSMGTICTLDVYGSEEALQGAEQLMNELDARLSWRTEGSDVWNINQQGSTTVAEDTAYLIGQALEVSRISDGRCAFLTFRLVYSVNAEVRASASRALKKTRYLGGELLRSFFTA